MLGKKLATFLPEPRFIVAMNNEERDDLWDLLGKARTPAASPFFSRNVVRAVRESQPAARAFAKWMQAQWQMTAAALAACILLAASIVKLSEQPGPSAVIARQIPDSQDYEVIANLDDLLASDDNALWLDSSNSVY